MELIQSGFHILHKPFCILCELETSNVFIRITNQPGVTLALSLFKTDIQCVMEIDIR